MQLCLIGDSLIEYFDWRGRFPAHDVLNLGVAGETASELLSRIPSIIKLAPAPDVTFIMIGTNNLLMEDYGFISVYGQILEALQRSLPQAALIASSLLPFQVPWLAPDAVSRINEMLKRLCDAREVIYLDAYAAFLDAQDHPRPDYFLDDGVHLSDQGYSVWSAALEKMFLRLG